MILLTFFLVFTTTATTCGAEMTMETKKIGAISKTKLGRRFSVEGIDMKLTKTSSTSFDESTSKKSHLLSSFIKHTRNLEQLKKIDTGKINIVEKEEDNDENRIHPVILPDFTVLESTGTTKTIREVLKGDTTNNLFLTNPSETQIGDGDRTLNGKNIETENDATANIINGNDVPFGKYPSFAVSDGSDNVLCGATLIYEDILVSAAHCVRAFSVGASVYVGGTRLDGSDAMDIKVIESVHPHPDYSRVTLHNDIMILKLSSATSVTPANINTNPNIPTDGETITAVGHGVTETGSISSILQEADVSVVDFATCSALWNSDFLGLEIRDDIMICTAYPVYEGICNGDSGGPYFTQDGILVGITSFGEPDCLTNVLPNGSVRVSAFQEFIEGGICALSGSPPPGCVPWDLPPPSDPCQTRLDDANSCLSSNPPSTCGSCINNAFDDIVSGLTPITCSSFDFDMCAAINNCNCGDCSDEIEELYSCIIQDASNGACPGIDCSANSCDSILGTVNSCLVSAPATCGNCINNAFDSISGAISCASFEDDMCPSISFQCDCDPCRSDIEDYYGCIIADFSGGICSNFDCNLACSQQLSSSANCLGANIQCASCLNGAFSSIFSAGSGADCDKFETDMCEAINDDCNCDPCTDNLEAYYKCVSNDLSNGVCDSFECKEDDDGGWCFSSSNFVDVLGKGPITVDLLQIGDHIKASTGHGDSSYSRVISFSHMDHSSEADYLQIYYSNHEFPLEISRSHMLKMADQRIISASAICEGDILEGGLAVTKISKVKRKGLYAPITESGTLIVSGATASCYVAILDDNIIPSFAQDYAAHALHAPLRFACGVNFEYFCRNETYTNGISNYLFSIIKILMTFRKLAPYIQLFAGLLVTPLVVLVLVLESIFLLVSSQVALFSLIGAIIAGYWFLCSQKHQECKK